MIVAIIGSRAYPDLSHVAFVVRGIAHKYPNATIVSGGAKGVDAAAEQAGSSARLTVLSYRPVKVEDGYVVDLVTLPVGGRSTRKRFHNTRTLSKYESFGQAAYARNLEIIDAADVVVFFQTDGSRGTQHGIDYAEAQGKPTFNGDAIPGPGQANYADELSADEADQLHNELDAIDVKLAALKIKFNDTPSPIWDAARYPLNVRMQAIWDRLDEISPDKGFECCRNQDTAFCDHGMGEGN